MRDLAVVDLETTGLLAGHHDVLEACVIRVCPQTLREIDRLVMRVRPHHGHVDPVAMAIHGLDLDVPDALDLADAIDALTPLLEGTRLGGHAVSFDRGFLDASFAAVGADRPWHWSPGIDTKILAAPAVMAGAIEDTHLATLCRWLGVDQGTAHRAEADADACLEVARRLCSLYADAVAGEITGAP